MDEGGHRGHPVVKKQVYVEGGAPGKLAKQCRVAFGTFLENAGVARETFQVVACGSRGDAYGKFSRDARKRLPAILLVDAEGPVRTATAWQHLQATDGWQRPPGAADDQCHLMVQVMESWFLADVDALESFYRQPIQRQALPKNPNVEAIPKQDVLDGLEGATRRTTKGRYVKAHAFDLLVALDPAKVTSASPHAERLIQALA